MNIVKYQWLCAHIRIMYLGPACKGVTIRPGVVVWRMSGVAHHQSECSVCFHPEIQL